MPGNRSFNFRISSREEGKDKKHSVASQFVLRNCIRQERMAVSQRLWFCG